jgi:hypothetical protein
VTQYQYITTETLYKTYIPETNDVDDEIRRWSSLSEDKCQGFVRRRMSRLFYTLTRQHSKLVSLPDTDLRTQTPRHIQHIHLTHTHAHTRTTPVTYLVDTSGGEEGWAISPVSWWYMTTTLLIFMSYLCCFDHCGVQKVVNKC